MQFLNQLDAISGTIVAVAIGFAFALSLGHQIKLQRDAQGDPTVARRNVLERITYAGLSFAVLAMAVVVGKQILSLGYEIFMLLSAAGAVGYVIWKFADKSRKKKR